MHGSFLLDQSHRADTENRNLSARSDGGLFVLDEELHYREPEFTIGGYYDDKLVRTDDGWRITAVTLTVSES